MRNRLQSATKWAGVTVGLVGLWYAVIFELGISEQLGALHWQIPAIPILFFLLIFVYRLVRPDVGAKDV